MKRLKKVLINSKKKKYIFYSISMLLFINSNSFSFWGAEKSEKKPEWIKKGRINSKNYSYYGVGSAKRHFKGESEQKKLALSRAVEELASQKETIVNSEIEMFQRNEQTSIYQKNSFKVEDSKVNFKILDSWQDGESGEIFYLVGSN